MNHTHRTSQAPVPRLRLIWISRRSQVCARLRRWGGHPVFRQAALAAATLSLALGAWHLDQRLASSSRDQAQQDTTFLSQAEDVALSWRTVRLSPEESGPYGDTAGFAPDAAQSPIPAYEPWIFRRLTGPDSEFHRFIRVHATGYTSCVTETDSTPHLTASNTLTAPGTIALSRDLLRTFTPGAPFDFGDKVLIPGVGVFEVWDTMNARWQTRADIWFESKESARRWGRREVFLTRVDEDAPTLAYRAR